MHWRSNLVPSDVRDSLPLQAGERILAGAVDTDGRWQVGSQSAFFLTTQDRTRRIAWEVVDRASWDKEQSTLTVVEIADFGDVEPQTVLRFDDPGRLLELVRERITASVLLTRRVSVENEPRKTVTVIARRSPERTGDVTFAYLIDHDLDPDSSAARAAGARGLASLKQDLGF